MEKLIKESPRDPRLAHWLINLGEVVEYMDGTRRGQQKAKEHFLRAGELSFGEGFSRVAEIHLKNQNWDEARRYYRMAADWMHVVAICNLASEAALGYFYFDRIMQEDHRRQPDLEEAVHLYREGAQLGHGGCCCFLGHCYFVGHGTEVNLAKGFKWTKLAAEKGDAQGMHQCANCYLFGKGIEQSNEQAAYWYEKFLELEDDEAIRSVLQCLRDL